MNKFQHRTPDRSQKRMAHCHSCAEVQYLLGSEEQILQAISSHAPLPEVLDGICCALDCQIGSVVSFVSLPGDDAGEIAEIASMAPLCDVHPFCSEGIVTENDELLGSLEMYCAVPRGPSANEVQLIERAACLVAIAIKLDIEARHDINGFAPKSQSARENMHTAPVYLN
jgi:hypothetical protein